MPSLRGVIAAAALIIVGAGFRSAVAQPGPTVDEGLARAVDAAARIAADRDAEAREAQAAAEAAAREATEARARADDAVAQAREAQEDATASEAARVAASREAEQLRAGAEEKEAELAQLQERADRTATEARAAQAQVSALEQQLAQERRRLLVSVIVGLLVLFVVAVVSWRMLRRRRIQLDESEAARQQADEQLAVAVQPAPFSCLLDGTDKEGRCVVVKIDATQLGSPGGTVVGRNPAAAGVVLDHPEASREHFRLSVRNGILSIEDLDSTNGTFVNGAEVGEGEMELSAGDEIRCRWRDALEAVYRPQDDVP